MDTTALWILTPIKKEATPKSELPPKCKTKYGKKSRKYT